MENIKTIEEVSRFGKGLIPQDISHLPTYGALLGATPFNYAGDYSFTVPFVINNQNGSSSCTGQGAQGLNQVFSYEKTGTLQVGSARWLYDHTFLPGGGAMAIAPINYLLSNGIPDDSVFPSEPETEANMESIAGITTEVTANAQQHNIYKGMVATQIPVTMDEIANAILNDYCVDMCVSNGSNAGWTTADVRPPIAGEETWGEGHAFLGVLPMIRNGKPCIKFANSWGSGEEGWGDDGFGYLYQDYFDAGLVSAAIVVTPNFIPQHMTQEQVNSLYAAVFHRIADASSAGYVGQTLEFVLNAFMTSPEWMAYDATDKVIQSKFTVTL